MVINHWLSGVLHVAISFVAADACPRLQVLQWRALGGKKMAIWRDPFWATSPEMCHTHIHTSYIYIYICNTYARIFIIYICTYDHICRGKTYIQKINFLKGQSGNLWGFVPFANPLKMTVNSWHIITEGTSSPKIREYPLKVRGIIPKSTYWYLLLMLEIRSFPILVCKESLGTPRIQGTSVDTSAGGTAGVFLGPTFFCSAFSSSF